MLSVVHTVPGLESRFGGPSRSVPALCEALTDIGVRVGLVTQEFGSGGSELLLPDQRVRSEVSRAFLSERPRATFSWGFGKQVDKLCVELGAQIVHDHGAWLHSNWAAYRVAKGRKLKFAATPRGTLTQWSMKRSALKKRMAWWLFQRRMLDHADVVFATSHGEAEDMRRIGVRAPIAVVSNGVAMPSLRPGPKATPAAPAPMRRVLFMSRLNPKKGVVELVHAWAKSRPGRWELVIAGPDESGYVALVRNAIDACGLQDSVTIRGEVLDAEKEMLFRSAELFVLPTFSENFGIVVAEALSHGLPVITTHGAPWSELAAQGMGWWVEPTIDAVSAAISEATSLDRAALEEMGRTGRTFVEQHYSWKRSAVMTLETYAWLLGRGPRPGCVISQ